MAVSITSRIKHERGKYSHMQPRLPSLLRISDALLYDVLGLIDELAVQIDSIGVYPAGGVILAEDVIGGLLVIGIHLGCVLLALLGQLVSGGAIAALVRLVRLCMCERGVAGRGRGDVLCRDSCCACRPPGARGRGDGRTRLRRCCSGNG